MNNEFKSIKNEVSMMALWSNFDGNSTLLCIFEGEFDQLWRQPWNTVKNEIQYATEVFLDVDCFYLKY